MTAEKPLNILVIFTDDHALQTIGAYGSTINKTPNIDRLAASGAVFVNSFDGNSIYGPSRAAVLTGKHSHKNGFYSNEKSEFDGNQTTFPKLLKKAGFQTALIGKWHMGSRTNRSCPWRIFLLWLSVLCTALAMVGPQVDFCSPKQKGYHRILL